MLNFLTRQGCWPATTTTTTGSKNSILIDELCRVELFQLFSSSFVFGVNMVCGWRNILLPHPPLHVPVTEYELICFCKFGKVLAGNVFFLTMRKYEK